ncbi:hypothetical protein [Levilactobacillus parabrevis]|uniref:hypothetical protein n=2 Tax=Levilactobacillus parabrevis TaxID=357278 RepID=UPI0021A32821|nr:hypothetical protein [Levilactobacillus parabrevis]
MEICRKKMKALNPTALVWSSTPKSTAIPVVSQTGDHYSLGLAGFSRNYGIGIRKVYRVLFFSFSRGKVINIPLKK